ncbi:MAG: DUF2290 domain-containing protein [Gemmatimonadetes bacterium]|nr:DUF2290 domain-containing protein [Gemmatimonadota bacterium]MYF72463.1 DUF2290 domain-containing protein [Gemmatimonadota bacterium]MYK51213.1 DUF2290 domain-containing protein [Gemmatimonadota bacterium]
MPVPHQIREQINKLVGYLVEVGLADDQAFAFQRSMRNNRIQVTFEGSEHVSIALRNRAYGESYQHLVQARAYNVKMLDGALIQMMYEFAGESLQRHRLAFFPAPHLEEFQNNPDIYLEDTIYADMVARHIVPFPVRFDYNARNSRETLAHPLSHLTLGQYKNCRIPVTAPVTPFWFIDFILRNFYHPEWAERLPNRGDSFAKSILPSEQGVVHVVIPS